MRLRVHGRSVQTRAKAFVAKSLRGVLLVNQLRLDRIVPHHSMDSQELRLQLGLRCARSGDGVCDICVLAGNETLRHCTAIKENAYRRVLSCPQLRALQAKRAPAGTSVLG